LREEIEKMNYAMKILKIRYYNIEIKKINMREFLFKNNFLFGYSTKGYLFDSWGKKNSKKKKMNI
jgi:hypothetical protein